MTELIATEDGSLTRFNEEAGELYHNRAGAYTEALRNYFEPSGAIQTMERQGEIRIVDACFGLGYNTFVLLERLLQSQIRGKVEVMSIETDPVVINCLPPVLNDCRFDQLREAFGDNLPANFGEYTFERAGLAVSLSVIGEDLRAVIPRLEGEFDLVFHDPFSPRKVPELWSLDLFTEYFRLLAPRRGRLLTYSGAPAVRGGLQEAGFVVFRTMALGGKSGGTLASAYSDFELTDTIFELSDAEVDKMKSRSGVPYRDENLSGARADILARREQEQKAI